MKSLHTLLAISTMVVIASLPLSAQAGKVTCTDGSPSAGGRGACSSHGGIMSAAAKAKSKADAKVAKTAERVAEKKEKADAKLAKTEVKADEKAEEHEMKGAIAECKDHTYSHAKSRRGVCSSHGGVAKFLGK